MITCWNVPIKMQDDVKGKHPPRFRFGQLTFGGSDGQTVSAIIIPFILKNHWQHEVENDCALVETLSP